MREPETYDWGAGPRFTTKGEMEMKKRLNSLQELQEPPKTMAKKCICGWIGNIKMKKCPNCGREKEWELLMYHKEEE